MEATIDRQRKMGIEIECVLPIIGRGGNENVQSLLAQVLSDHGVRACSRTCTHRSLPRDCRLAIEHDTFIRDEIRYRGLSWSKIEVKTVPTGIDRVFLSVLEERRDAHSTRAKSDTRSDRNHKKEMQDATA